MHWLCLAIFDGKGRSETGEKVHNDTLLHLYIHEYLKNVMYFAGTVINFFLSFVIQR